MIMTSQAFKISSERSFDRNNRTPKPQAHELNTPTVHFIIFITTAAAEQQQQQQQKQN